MFARHFERRHAARLHQCPIAIVEEQQVVRREECGKRRQRFMAPARDVDPSATLAQQAFFTQVAGTDEKEVAKKDSLCGRGLVQGRHASCAMFFGPGRRGLGDGEDYFIRQANGAS